MIIIIIVISCIITEVCAGVARISEASWTRAVFTRIRSTGTPGPEGAWALLLLWCYYYCIMCLRNIAYYCDYY